MNSSLSGLFKHFFLVVVISFVLSVVLRTNFWVVLIGVEAIVLSNAYVVFKKNKK